MNKRTTVGHGEVGDLASEICGNVETKQTQSEGEGGGEES